MGDNFWQAMGTCCSKDESDKLEAVETKARASQAKLFMLFAVRIRCPLHLKLQW